MSLRAKRRLHPRASAGEQSLGKREESHQVALSTQTEIASGGSAPPSR